MQERSDTSVLQNFFDTLSVKKVSIIIFLVSFVVYFWTFFNGFVYDDELQIVGNPLVHSLSNLPYFLKGGTFFDSGSGQILSVFYRPVLSTVFTLLYSVSGTHPFVFHLSQVTLHSINAILLFILFRKFFGQKISFFISLVFLVHPINQEAVSYISDLQENLFLCFGLLSLLVFTTSYSRVKMIVFSNIFLFLALLSKETAVLFLPLVFLYNYLFYKKNVTKVFIGSFIITFSLYLYLRFVLAHVAKITDPLVPIMNASLFERVITIPSIVFYYFKTFLFPSQLALGYSWVVKTITFEQFYLPLFFDLFIFFLIGILGVIVYRHHRKKFSVFLFFLVWFFLGLGMHLQIVPLDATVADRWFYFPIVGLLGLVALAMSSISLPRYINKSTALFACILILFFLGVRTYARNQNWVNTLTLCQHDLQFIPDSYNVQSVCGAELLKIGEYEKAKKHFAKSASLAPKFSLNWYQYGLSYEYTKNIPRARLYYRKSISLSKEVNAYVSLAATYLKYDKDPNKARQVVEEGLKNYPNFQRLQLYLAVCEYRVGNKKSALEIASKAYQSSPTPESQYVYMQISRDQDVVLE